MALKPNTVKVKKEKVKNVSKYSNTVRIIFMLVCVVAAVIGINFYSAQQLRQTVDVVKLKAGVPKEGIITEDNMYKDTMLKSEYERTAIKTLASGEKRRNIVLWEDRKTIVNKFASYYIHEDAPIFWDGVSAESSKKYSYLYKMDGELLKLELEADTFGEMLVPGDHINVRVSYVEQVYTLPTEEEFMLQQQTGIQAQTQVTRQELLFSNTSVLDILNGNGESIFDIYYNLLALPKGQQQALVQTDDFKNSVQPKQILLNVTPEEADHYMKIKGKSPTYLMTLLPRTSSNAITEVLNELSVGLTRTK